MRINPAFLCAALAIVAAGCKPSDPSGGSDGPKATSHLTALKSVDNIVGKGPAVVSGDEVWVNYKGTLTNGHMFDTNLKEGGSPFHVSVGAGQVIKGWDQGLLGMKKGGKRTLSIPANLAYGDRDQKGIPANSDLIFEVEMLDILRKEDASTIVVNPIKEGTGKEAKQGDTVTVDYDAVANGESFETEKNISFKIGDEMQVPGFDQAIKGMKVGGQREIRVPPALTRMLGEKVGMNVAVYKVTLKAVTGP